MENRGRQVRQAIRHGSVQERANPARLKATGRRPRRRGRPRRRRRRGQGRPGAQARPHAKASTTTGDGPNGTARPHGLSTALTGYAVVVSMRSLAVPSIGDSLWGQIFSDFLDLVLDGGRFAIRRRQKGKHEADWRCHPFCQPILRHREGAAVLRSTQQGVYPPRAPLGPTSA